MVPQRGYRQKTIDVPSGTLGATLVVAGARLLSTAWAVIDTPRCDGLGLDVTTQKETPTNGEVSANIVTGCVEFAFQSVYHLHVVTRTCVREWRGWRDR